MSGLDSRMFASAPGSTPVKKHKIYTANLTPASVGAATSAEQDFTISGILSTDVLAGFENPDFGNATGVAGVRIKQNNTISVRFINPTAGALTPGAGVWNFLILSPV